MDKIDKVLQKLTSQERQELKDILSRINSGNIQGLDLKKLRSKQDIFRVRKGKIRIIFYNKDNAIKVLSLERRSDKTYRRI